MEDRVEVTRYYGAKMVREDIYHLEMEIDVFNRELNAIGTSANRKFSPDATAPCPDARILPEASSVFQLP